MQSVIGFAFHETASFYQARCEAGPPPTWDSGQLTRSTLNLSPASAVLSYGYGIFEGLKAERAKDGRLLLFRAPDHAARFCRSARRLLLPPFPELQFVEALKEMAIANEKNIPAPGEGAFYLRPMEHALDPMLGLDIPKSATVTIYGSPVGPMYAKNRLRLRVLEQARAVPGGTGAAKAIGNYAGTMGFRQQAKADGFDDVVFTDAIEHRYVEEASGANIFCVLRSGALVTPPLSDTILAGITRDSAIQIARQLYGLDVQQRPLSLQEIWDQAVEVFCTGTAWTVIAIEELACIDGRSRRFEQNTISASIRKELRGIQSGERDDPFGWTIEVRL